MSSLRLSPKSNHSPCLPLIASPEGPLLSLRLQPLSLLQRLLNLPLWFPSSALVLQVDPDHSPIKKWCLGKLLLWAQAPPSPLASPMPSRRRSP